MSRHPEVKWAEREDKVYLTVLLPDAKNPKVNLAPEGTFTFSATGGAGNNAYDLTLELFDKVDVEESKISYGVRSIFCVLEKVDKKWWGKLLRGDGKPPHYVKVDWDKWADEDDDAGVPGAPDAAGGPGDFDLSGMDFSKFGGYGAGGEDMGMGMGGEGMGMGMGDDEFEDSDDDEQEISKPEEGAPIQAGAPKVEDGGAAEKTEASSA